MVPGSSPGAGATKRKRLKSGRFLFASLPAEECELPHIPQGQERRSDEIVSRQFPRALSRKSFATAKLYSRKTSWRRSLLVDYNKDHPKGGFIVE